MGLSPVRTGAIAGLLVVSALPALSAPKLRLAETTVGPVSIALGQAGQRQEIEAYNAGDGKLELRLTSNAEWLSAGVAGEFFCRSRAGLCTVIDVNLNTAALPRGVATGTVTIADPKALDAPQFVTVTVQMGGGVPERVALYAPADGEASELVQANSPLRFATSTGSGANWLSVLSETVGSFAFVQRFRIRARSAGLEPGTHAGNINVTGSAVADENRSVGVTLNVTGQPLAAPERERLVVKVGQGGTERTTAIAFSNRGLGELVLEGATAETAIGGEWMQVAVEAANAEIGQDKPKLLVRTNPGPLPPGRYGGTVRVSSNAANSPSVIAVELEIGAAAAPVVYFESAASAYLPEAGAALAPGMLVRVEGEQLSARAEAAAEAEGVRGTELGGVRVLVNGVAAALERASDTRVDFQVPWETAAGEAQIQVEREGQPGNVVTARVEAAAPRILGTTFEAPLQPGSTVVVTMAGLGATNPAGLNGAGPEEATAQHCVLPVVVEIGFNGFLQGVAVTPEKAVLTERYRYAVTFVVPGDVPRGERVALRVRAGDFVSNSVEIAIP